MMLTFLSRFSFFIISCLIVGFGQPAYSWLCGVIASVCGFALFWKAIIDLQPKYRFWLGTLWFSLIQLIQLAWFVSHPYFYIYAVYFLVAFGMGVQFGVLCLLINPFRIKKWSYLFGIAGLWVIMEWSRLFILSGFSWNPVGLALSGSLFSLQMASLGGIYMLSLWVMLTNLLCLRIWQNPLKTGFIIWLASVIAPYAFGYFQLSTHLEAANSSEKVSAVLVQTAFPIEEAIEFPNAQAALNFVEDEWLKILSVLKKQHGKKIDLIVLPEYVVPYGTFYPVFRFEHVKQAFQDILGKESLLSLPELEDHLAYALETDQGHTWMVNNAFWVQALADVFQADVVVGLEDRDQISAKEYSCYSSAFLFVPGTAHIERYEKRILVPMGEYIPFSFCRQLAASYGVTGSFTCGTEAKVLPSRRLPIGPSICYEETYGHLMRDNRIKGAEMLVNLTNDGWYPHSQLPFQHLEHARLRTVEMGIPLIRSCNTGITCAIDSLGRTVSMLEDDQDHADSLFVEVPRYHYTTLYTYTGDWLVLGLSCLALLLALGSFLFFQSK